MDGASKGSLEGEFGTSKEEDVVAQILEKGSIVESEVSPGLGAGFDTGQENRETKLTAAVELRPQWRSKCLQGPQCCALRLQ